MIDHIYVMIDIAHKLFIDNVELVGKDFKIMNQAVDVTFKFEL